MAPPAPIPPTPVTPPPPPFAPPPSNFWLAIFAILINPAETAIPAAIPPRTGELGSGTGTN